MTIATAIEELSVLLGERLNRSPSDRDLHGRSESHYDPAPPDAVAYPATTEEVSQIVRICARNGTPVTGWGVGSSLEAQALPIRGGVVVDFAHMASVIEIFAEDMLAVVQPGITREALNTELRATGLFFPVDPGANASIGGMSATRASGTTAVRYGTMRDNVKALEVVLADGSVIRTGSRAPKSSAGYDLTGLFVGSEGTLGLITEVTLKLQGQPEAVSAAVCAFPDIHSAVSAVIVTIQSGIPMARIEFLDEGAVAAVNGYSNAGLPLTPHLLVEFHGSEAGVAEQAARFGEIVAEMGASGFQWATRPEERSALWKMRHNAYYACLSLRPGARALITDICVPISRLAGAVEETRADIEASFLTGPILGHVGDGNFHAILLVDTTNPDEVHEAERLSGLMAERAIRAGGTVTGEHGIGIGKIGYLVKEHGEGAVRLMKALKSTLDPEDVMNPGKMLEHN